MIAISSRRNLFITLLLFALATISAQARLGSEKIEEAAPGALTRILSVLEFLVRQDSRSHDPDAEIVVPLRNWPIDKKALHRNVVTMIRNTLIEGVIIGDGSGVKGSEQVFMLHVPENALELRLNTHGGSGNIDLYVMRGNIPTTARYDCRSIGNGTRQKCMLRNPEQGTYYVLLRGNARYSDVSVTGGFDLGKPAAPSLDLIPAIGAADSRPESPSI